MASQQQKPQEPWHSLDQQMGSSDNMGDLIFKPFSLRQYVLAARQKDIYSSWPFADRYLQICLKHGISNVLPTLEPGNSATNQLQGEVRSTIKPSLHPHVDNRSSEALIPPKSLRYRLRKRKRKPKKRPMADILAAAKDCTLQVLYKFEALGFDSKKDLDNVGQERSSAFH